MRIDVHTSDVWMDALKYVMMGAHWRAVAVGASQPAVTCNVTKALSYTRTLQKAPPFSQAG